MTCNAKHKHEEGHPELHWSWSDGEGLREERKKSGAIGWKYPKDLSSGCRKNEIMWDCHEQSGLTGCFTQREGVISCSLLVCLLADFHLTANMIPRGQISKTQVRAGSICIYILLF